MPANKENALRIINFDNPDFVLQAPPMQDISFFGCDHQDMETGKSDEDFKPGESWYDLWGTKWVKEMDGVMAFPKGNPLADLNEIDNFQFPNPYDKKISESIAQKAKIAKENPQDAFLIGSNRDVLWERSYMLAGMENMMMAFYEAPDLVKKLLHNIMNFQLGIAEQYVSYGVEMAHMSDDLGTQHSLLLSPAIIREFLMPEYKRLFDFYKKHNVLIHFHSCGHILPAIDIFNELGVDILNPVQATANNLADLRKATMGKMALHGGISSGLIMSGTREEIEQSVKETIKLLGENGGYFCDADQEMPFPKENAAILKESVEKYGKYPL